jgi:predicted alpha/beta hydrolase family esterase
MRKMITLPGIHGSGASHWQTIWERAETHFKRFHPASWDQPDLGDWISSLERSVQSCREPPVLVAHSLAGLLVAHWASRSSCKIAGAFLVSVPDPKGAQFPGAATPFQQTPAKPLSFPSLLIASTDDPYGSLDYARQLSVEWQSRLVVAGALGHINESSNLGDWPQGRALLDAFCAGMPRTA